MSHCFNTLYKYLLYNNLIYYHLTSYLKALNVHLPFLHSIVSDPGPEIISHLHKKKKNESVPLSFLLKFNMNSQCCRVHM